ncbi:MAG TPA: SRPBCC family protein [Saprospiraceae bacterium]|nr:SRPBCC family protein [Saprospiraceae bacterium]
MEKIVIEVKVTVSSNLDKVWEYWNSPEHIVNWNFASDEWCAPRAEVNLKPGGHFVCRMESKDGCMGFDFSGVYDVIKPLELIEYTLEDNRKVSIEFLEGAGGIQVIEKFEAESENAIELQQAGWQAILNNFKRYVESKS